MIKMTPELFNKFATKQEELDSMIREKHGISIDEWKDDYDTQHKIALQIEKAELANEMFDTWKYWKQKAVNHDRIIDEAVDVIHFIHLLLNKSGLGAEYYLPFIEHTYSRLSEKSNNSLIKLLINNHYTVIEEYAIVLMLLDRYNFTLDDIEQAYDRKNAINHDRQHHNY